MSKHTPGPWKAKVFDSGAYEITDATGLFVITARNGYSDWELAEESAANGRLICAAPELLKTLESIVNTSIQAEVIKLALVAIAKARGTE